MNFDPIDLETYEWDSPWWEHTENTTSLRAVYIGDSISNGTRPKLNELSGDALLFDGFPTSKALDNPFYIPSLELFFAQMRRADAILFNNGLHGWHLNDEDYEKYYRAMLDFLTGRGAPVYIVLTTYLPLDEERNAVVLRRNAIAVKLASEFGLPVIDLYSVSSALSSDDYCGDGVHLHNEGYIALAKKILGEVKI